MKAGWGARGPGREEGKNKGETDGGKQGRG